MEALEAVAWAVFVTLPACIILAPVLWALFERSLVDRSHGGEGGEHGGSREE